MKSICHKKQLNPCSLNMQCKRKSSLNLFHHTLNHYDRIGHFFLNIKHMSHLVGKPTMWFPNRSDTNRPVQAQKRARSLKFWIEVEEELYYPCSENKGADQLRGYREADLRLCFRLCRLLVFPWGGSYHSTS